MVLNQQLVNYSQQLQFFNFLENTFYYGARLYKGIVYENVVPAIITKEMGTSKRIKRIKNVNPIRNVKYLYLLNKNVSVVIVVLTIPRNSNFQKKITGLRHLRVLSGSI